MSSLEPMLNEMVDKLVNSGEMFLSSILEKYILYFSIAVSHLEYFGAFNIKCSFYSALNPYTTENQFLDRDTIIMSIT